MWPSWRNTSEAPAAAGRLGAASRRERRHARSITTPGIAYSNVPTTSAAASDTGSDTSDDQAEVFADSAHVRVRDGDKWARLSIR